MQARSFATTLLLCLSGCGGGGPNPAGPRATPDIRGRYEGLWTRLERRTSLGNLVSQQQCVGTLEVTRQDGAVFGGRFTREARCGSGGTVTNGQVNDSGAITFDIVADDSGQDPYDSPQVGPCGLVQSEPHYRGSAVARFFAVRSRVYRCPDQDRVQVDSGFQQF